jgi:hypothetical protein
MRAHPTGGQNSFNISSHNYDRMEEGMVFVLHTQWLEPLSVAWMATSMRAREQFDIKTLTPQEWEGRMRGC